jgi:hypothetical protein
MKILNLKTMLVVACSLVTISVFSQGTQWRLLGNINVTAGTNFLGTTNAQPVDFRTNNTQRMRIDGTTGFVGIGTTAPTQRLEVDGGNINLFTTTNAYMLGSQNILWHKGQEHFCRGRCRGKYYRSSCF